MKKIKIIYINLRFYGRDFADQSHDFFYLFGVGNLFGYESIKRFSNMEVENWRADKTIEKDLERNVDGIHCRVFKGKQTKFLGTFSLSMLKELRRISKQKDNNVIVHFQGMHNLGFDLLSWLIPKIPILVTHHGGGNFGFKNKNKFSIKTRIAEIIDRLSLKWRHDHCIIQTETQKNYLSEFLPNSHITRTTPFGFDLNVFNLYDKIESRRKLGLPLDKTIILSVSRAHPVKGVQYVVDAYLEMKKYDSNIELLCVDIHSEDVYYNKVNESGARIIGHVSWHDLPTYYTAADVLLYLPLDDESLNFAGPGYVTAEALACGLPVVSSLLVHYWDNSINKVARIPKSLEEVIPMVNDILQKPPNADLCREVAYKYFNWDYVMENHLNIYNELLEKYYNTSIHTLKES